MRAVLAGAGSVGRHMAAQLRSAGHDVTLIDNVSSVIEKRQNQADLAGVQWVLGDTCALATLDRAGARTADVFTAVTGDDEDNLVSTLLAKQEFGVPRVIGRVNNPRNEWMFTQMWGVDIAVSTPHLLAALVEEAVSIGSVVRLMALDQGRADLLEVTLSDTSPSIGRTIGDAQLPRGVAIVAIIRDGHVIEAAADTVLRAADETIVLLTGGPEAHDALHLALIG